MAFYLLFKTQITENEAKILAKQSLTDFEGVILMDHQNDELFYFDQTWLCSSFISNLCSSPKRSTWV